METALNSTEEILNIKPPQTLKDGTETQPLYIKHLSKVHWQIINELKASNQMKSAADVVRWALFKAAGRI